MTTLYRIAFRGQILPGRRPDLVRARALSRMRLTDRQLDQMFSGRTVYLKRRIEAEPAKAYVKELLTIGLHIRIEREPESANAPPSPVPAAARTAPPPSAQALAESGFDPEKTDLFTPTQLDQALSAYASAYDASSVSAAQPASPGSHYHQPPVSKPSVSTGISDPADRKPVPRKRMDGSSGSEPTVLVSRHEKPEPAPASGALLRPVSLSLAEQRAMQLKTHQLSAQARRRGGSALLLGIGVAVVAVAALLFFG